MYKIHIYINSSCEWERNGDFPNNCELQASRHVNPKVVHFFGSCDSIAPTRQNPCTRFRLILETDEQKIAENFFLVLWQ